MVKLQESRADQWHGEDDQHPRDVPLRQMVALGARQRRVKRREGGTSSRDEPSDHFSLGLTRIMGRQWFTPEGAKVPHAIPQVARTCQTLHGTTAPIRRSKASSYDE